MNDISILCRIELKPERFHERVGGVPSRLFELICKEFPEHVTKYGWGFVGIPQEDPLVGRFMKFAASIGLNIPADRSRMNTGITYSIYRSDQLEIHRRAFFTSPALVGPILAEVGFRADGEPVILHNARLKKASQIEIGGVFAFPEIIVVRGEMKERIAKAGLAGLSLRPLALSSADPGKGQALNEIEWPEGIEPLFQVFSEVELPTCKNWMFDNIGRVFHPADRDSLPDGCMPLNGLQRTGTLHYAKEDIDPFVKYDIVKTYERYGKYGAALLVSHHFREILKELKISRLEYDLGYYAVCDEEPWLLGTDGPIHPRYSGAAPNLPVD